MWYAETSPINPDIILVNVAGQVGGSFKNPGLYLSMDDGKQWEKINLGLGQPDKMVDIEFDPYNENTIYCSAWGSGWYKGIINTGEVIARCSDVEVKEGENITLYGIGSIGCQLKYHWNAPSDFIISSKDKNKTTITAPLVNGTTDFKISLKVYNEYSSNTKEINIKVIEKDYTSIQPNKNINHNINCYPNPTISKLTIDTNSSKIDNIIIYNASGNKLKEIKTKHKTIDVSDLPKGIYFITIKTGQEEQSAKFIKQ